MQLSETSARFRRITATIVASMILAEPMYAQETLGSVRVVVTDATGAGVPNARCFCFCAWWGGRASCGLAKAEKRRAP